MSRKKKEGVRFSALIRKDLMDKMKEFSDETGIPVTTIVEKSVEKYLTKFYRDVSMDNLFL